MFLHDLHEHSCTEQIFLQSLYQTVFIDYFFFLQRNQYSTSSLHDLEGRYSIQGRKGYLRKCSTTDIQCGRLGKQMRQTLQPAGSSAANHTLLVCACLPVSELGSEGTAGPANLPALRRNTARSQLSSGSEETRCVHPAKLQAKNKASS